MELVSRVKVEPDVPVELAPKKTSGAAKDKARRRREGGNFYEMH